MIVSARTFCKEKNEGKLKYEEESKKATKIERFESCPPPFQVKSEFSRWWGLKTSQGTDPYSRVQNYVFERI